MIHSESRSSTAIFILALIFSIYPGLLSGQKVDFHHVNFFKAPQDTSVELRKRNASVTSPDTNFTWEKYETFLKKISDTSKYIALPLNEFRNTFNPNKIIIGLRHDVDVSLATAYAFSSIEWKLGFRSTYYILHTAAYYLQDPKNMQLHSESILPVLKYMQNDKHFEIGWHNDLVTLQIIYNIDPVIFLNNELNWLRSNGIKISGTASHGSPYCKIYHYLNYYFFEECTYPAVPGFENNVTVPVNGVNIPIIKRKLTDFNLAYEAYFLNFNKSFSDATITKGVRWSIGMLNLDELKKGDRVEILLHPVHWHKGSTRAGIQSFTVPGQMKSVVDTLNSTITVTMPYGVKLGALQPVFSLSPGAYAKVLGTMQVSGKSVNDFRKPVIYTVYAENRTTLKEWTVRISNGLNSASGFKSYFIPGITKSVLIDSIKKRIDVELKDGYDVSYLPVHFELSERARAWVGDVEQYGDSGAQDFTSDVIYRVIAEDGINESVWTVSVKSLDNGNSPEHYTRDILVYPNPTHGLINLQFFDITAPVTIGIFNAMGMKIRMISTEQTGIFNITADLKSYPSGIYYIRNMANGKCIPVIKR